MSSYTDMPVSTQFHISPRALRRLYLRRVLISHNSGRSEPPTPRPLPPPPRDSDDITILRIETKQESGEVPPADVVAYLMPGVRMCLGSRRVRRTTLPLGATAINQTIAPLYRGRVVPAKEDIHFLVSDQYGIQAFYTKANSVEEPMLMDNEIPTITTVYFRRLIIIHNDVQNHLEQEGRRTQYLNSRSSLKRQREDDEEDNREPKRLKVDYKLPYFVMLLATGIAVKYLL
ncbi:hypothetical protein JR316_0013144 [Psilocybe cubensis]|uniref:Uncharacterized protein n=2 Tax=Psilocybe cubensis TaxID=181762 RepID=A0ACB8GHZ0_PSICU|nr:hypothetical protein JR316_0013144 [Psilocybe cubensis]KAH9474680.1 hypothetical protein JR316_0013144 [Psilocybe cubensis]